ncbi:MAG: efflux RND transporter periplasmic adaptor subunit [Gemmatimonadaceae bacterium]|jgi:HlyD family secretion protein|nr:efflux RND transporter periplasmic adaptor subunit [Gemmatimonadota bacterium]MCC7325061.1 efflux RND transporter periplasmic adaptor subunit [Gemmatimonadaceae bacterium]
MSKKTVISLVTVVALAGATGLWWYTRADARDLPSFRYATVEQGSLQSTVSATGALNAVRTVQVGTQASGQISALYVDFNDRVKKGQLLARIDPTLQEQAVRDAQAGLERNQAERDEAQRNFDRNTQLYERKVLTEAEYNTSQYQLAVATANVKSAQVSLDRARRNLGYTEIYAPIDGVVIERNVDVGQTVAASLQAPQIFLIANDLSQMEILASVDESDIGAIVEGQPVRFTVQPYPNDKFEGTVRQVRLQSTTTENVVHYTAVVSVINKSGTLLPGMTATVDFITGQADSALLVPNAALRFRPTAELLAAAGLDASTLPGSPAPGGTAAPGSGASTATRPTTARAPDGPPFGGSLRAGKTAPSASAGGTTATLWVMENGRTLRPIVVKTGLSDGQRTVVKGEGLNAGMQIVIGTSTASSSASSTSTNPFQATTQQAGPPRGF